MHRTGVLLLSVVIAVGSACGGATPAAPTPVATPVTTPSSPSLDPLVGFWTGASLMDACTGVACSPWVTYPGPSTPFAVSIIKADAGYQALLQLHVRVDLVLELTGTVRPDGSVTFAGQSRPPNSVALTIQTADVQFVTLRLDAARGMTGEFAYRLMWPTGTTDVTGRLLSAERSAVEPLADCGAWRSGGGTCFGGRWMGRFLVEAVEDCGGQSCANSNLIGSDQRLELTLTEEGSSLTGRALVWNVVPVAGSASGLVAQLSGAQPIVSCEYPGFDVTRPCAESIDDLTMTLDRFGRLSGSLRYFREGWSGSSSGSSYYRLRVRGTLWNLVRVE